MPSDVGREMPLGSLGSLGDWDESPGPQSIAAPLCKTATLQVYRGVVGGARRFVIFSFLRVFCPFLHPRILNWSGWFQRSSSSTANRLWEMFWSPATAPF